MSRDMYNRAGAFSLRKEKIIIRGRAVRVRALVFTTHDGFVGESRGFNHREAYEAAVAARASAQYAASQAEMTALPVPGAKCSKPAPVVQLLHHFTESQLFSECERRGYEVAIADETLVAVNELLAR